MLIVPCAMCGKSRDCLSSGLSLVAPDRSGSRLEVALCLGGSGMLSWGSLKLTRLLEGCQGHFRLTRDHRVAAAVVYPKAGTAMGRATQASGSLAKRLL